MFQKNTNKNTPSCQSGTFYKQVSVNWREHNKRKIFPVDEENTSAFEDGTLYVGKLSQLVGKHLLLFRTAHTVRTGKKKKPPKIQWAPALSMCGMQHWGEEEHTQQPLPSQPTQKEHSAMVQRTRHDVAPREQATSHVPLAKVRILRCPEYCPSVCWPLKFGAI